MTDKSRMRELEAENERLRLVIDGNVRCEWCGELATQLCDFVLGYERDPSRPFAAHSDGEVFTCDAAMCRKCVRFVNWRFYSDGIEAIEFCPDHFNENHPDRVRKRTRQFVGSKLFTHAEAESHREALRAKRRQPA